MRRLVLTLLALAAALPSAAAAHAPRAWKFVRPGAVRIGSTVADTIWDVAFRNPDGSIVVLAVNDDWGTGSKRFNLRLGRTALSYDLPAGAVATFSFPRG